MKNLLNDQNQSKKLAYFPLLACLARSKPSSANFQTLSLIFGLTWNTLTFSYVWSRRHNHYRHRIFRLPIVWVVVAVLDGHTVPVEPSSLCHQIPCHQSIPWHLERLFYRGTWRKRSLCLVWRTDHAVCTHRQHHQIFQKFFGALLAWYGMSDCLPLARSYPRFLEGLCRTTCLRMYCLRRQGEIVQISSSLKLNMTAFSSVCPTMLANNAASYAISMIIDFACIFKRKLANYNIKHVTSLLITGDGKLAGWWSSYRRSIISWFRNSVLWKIRFFEFYPRDSTRLYSTSLQKKMHPGWGLWNDLSVSCLNDAWWSAWVPPPYLGPIIVKTHAVSTFWSFWDTDHFLFCQYILIIKYIYHRTSSGI